jgi:hypothetical protein
MRDEMEVTIDITDEVATYPVKDLIKLLQFLQKNGFNKTYFDGYDASICLIRDITKNETK